MKEKFKRFFASIAAIILALGMMGGTTVFAATTSSQTIVTNPTGHSYTAYEIFKGTQTGTNNDTKLGNVEWGDGIDSAAFLTALKSNATVGSDFTDVTTAAQAAEKIATYTDDSNQAKAVANIAQKHVTGSGVAIEAGDNKQLESGYYLIVDTTENLPGTDAYNSALLQVTGKQINITQKYTVPPADKTIEQVTSPTGDTTASAGSVTDATEQDSATAEIGDVVTFQLKTKLPSNLGDYDTYNLKLEDTLSAGLTFQSVSSVKIGTTDATKNTTGTAVAGQYIQTDPNPATEGGNSNKLTIEWSNIKSATGAEANADVIVTYTAVVNQNAVTGTSGNENTFQVTYSNNPNGTGTGTSTPDVTKVYTFKLVVTKHDQDGNGLAGAGFVVQNKAGKYYQYDSTNNIVKWVDSIDDATEYTSQATTGLLNGEFKGLAVGDYKLHEKTTPNGYTTAADLDFSIKATSQENSNAITVETTGVTADSNYDLSTTVENRAGSTLPSTGGIGTTIFYVIGGVVVAGAVILLLARRRKNA